MCRRTPPAVRPSPGGPSATTATSQSGSASASYSWGRGGEAVVPTDNRGCRQMSLLELLANVERLTGRTLPPGHLLACRAQCRPGPFPDLFAGVLKQAAALVEPFDESVELLAQRAGEPVGGLGRRVALHSRCSTRPRSKLRACRPALATKLFPRIGKNSRYARQWARAAARDTVRRIR